MSRLTPNKLLLVHMTTAVDQTRIDDNPPSLPFHVEDDELKRELLRNSKYAAGQYDMYKNVVQLSFLHVQPSGQQYAHYLLCDTPDIPAVQSSPERVIVTSPSEELLLDAAFSALNMLYPTNSGMAISTELPTLCGWKILTDIWPILVNKAMAYDFKLPGMLIADPTEKFPSVRGMYELSSIYTQGASMAMRKLPALADVLNYWGVGSDYDDSVNIIDTICTDPNAAISKIEKYMQDMHKAIIRYGQLVN
jgi:hypothetical protein